MHSVISQTRDDRMHKLMGLRGANSSVEQIATAGKNGSLVHQRIGAFGSTSDIDQNVFDVLRKRNAF